MYERENRSLLIPDKNTYAISTANVFNRTTVLAAFNWNIKDHIDVAKKAGFDGVEQWTQRMYPLWQIRSGNLSEYEKSGIISAHQSATERKPTLREFLKAIVLPERDASLEDLRLLRNLLGRDIPVVLFEDTPTEYLESGLFQSRGIQPQPELCRKWGVKTPQEFIEVALKKGFTHVIPDTHHLIRPHKNTGEPNPFADWQESLPVLLPYANEIQIGIGRSDYKGVDPEKSYNEAQDLLNGGDQNTNLIQMLRFIGESNWKGTVVLEMRPAIFRQMYWTKQDYVAIYEGIRNTLANVLGS